MTNNHPNPQTASLIDHLVEYYDFNDLDEILDFIDDSGMEVMPIATTQDRLANALDYDLNNLIIELADNPAEFPSDTFPDANMIESLVDELARILIARL